MKIGVDIHDLNLNYFKILDNFFLKLPLKKKKKKRMNKWFNNFYFFYAHFSCNSHPLSKSLE